LEQESTKEACIPDANDDFEVVLQGPLDVLLEIELSDGRQMILQRRKHGHVVNNSSSIKSSNNHRIAAVAMRRCSVH
jgi:hypothetical protein